MDYIHLLFVILSFILISIRVEAKGEEGDKCDDSGICTPFSKCKSLQNIENRKNITTCGFDQDTPIVCCHDPPKTPRRCPPVRDEYLRVQKTGQKAWDKCIDLIDYVHKCEFDGSLLLNAPMVRENKCKHTPAPLELGSDFPSINEFPHMAIVGKKKPDGYIKWHCLGSLISEKWILTTANCAKRASNNGYVRLGDDDADILPVVDSLYKVSKTVQHPEFKSDNTFNIGLIELSKEVSYDEFLPACLYTKRPNNIEKAIIVGWHLNTTQRDSISKAGVELYPSSNNNTISAGMDKKDASCEIAKGAPLQIYNNDVHCTYNIIGFKLKNTFCNNKQTKSTYISILNYIEWIEQTVWP